MAPPEAPRRPLADEAPDPLSPPLDGVRGPVRRHCLDSAAWRSALSSDSLARISSSGRSSGQP